MEIAGEEAKLIDSGALNAAKTQPQHNYAELKIELKKSGQLIPAIKTSAQ